MITAAGAPVIAGVDGSAAALEAVAWAAVEAHSQHRTLQVLHASVWSLLRHPVPAAVPSTYRQSRLHEAQCWVRDAARAARQAAPGVEVVERLVVGEPAPVLLGESRHAQQLVIGSHGLEYAGPPDIGSVALRLAQHADCPVVVVRSGAPGDPRGPVVVGVDGSTAADAAVGFAAVHASHAGVPLVALHAWSDVGLDPAGGSLWRSLDWDAAAAAAERVLAEQLAGWQEKYPDVEIRRVIARDRPVRRLLAEAADARLLVVGSRGRGGMRGMLLGSTSQALLHVAGCPLAIVR